MLGALLLLPCACGDAAGGETSAASGSSSSSTTDGPEPTGGSDPGDSKILVGSFQVQLTAPVPASDTAPASAGKTTVVGKIYDGPSPPQLVWEAGTAAGDCRLLTPRVPFCATPCGGSAVCVEDDTCEPYPTAYSAGTVTVTGLATEDGAASFEMEPIANNYQPPGSVKLLYPAFAEGDEIKVAASGDHFAAFEISALGIDPLDVTSSSIALTADQPVALTWTPAADPDRSTIHVKLDISHHGGTKGMIECDTADSGALELPAALISELLGLGVAGFPTIILTRRSVGATTIEPGRVELVVSSAVERAVEIAGVVSCTDDSECAEGQSCQTDLTCA